MPWNAAGDWRAPSMGLRWAFDGPWTGDWRAIDGRLMGHRRGWKPGRCLRRIWEAGGDGNEKEAGRQKPVKRFVIFIQIGTRLIWNKFPGGWCSFIWAEIGMGVTANLESIYSGQPTRYNQRKWRRRSVMGSGPLARLIYKWRVQLERINPIIYSRGLIPCWFTHD